MIAQTKISTPNNPSGYFRYAPRFACLVISILILGGCAGVGKPIPDHLPKEATREQRILLHETYKDPLDLAYARIHQWSKAVENLQTSNTVASSALLPLAAIIGYRTARNKSAAATAGLATGGIIGLTLSDALIQVNRLDVYLKGVEAMECAASHYRAAHAPPESMETFWEKFPDLKKNNSTKILLSKIYSSIYIESLSSTLDIRLEMDHAVSRITSEVNQALRSSIVSVHDLSRTTLPADTFRRLLEGEGDDKGSDPADIANNLRANTKVRAFGQDYDNLEGLKDRLIDALMELDRMRSKVRAFAARQDELANQIQTCSIIEGLSPITPDRIANAPVELGIISSQNDRTLVGCAGNNKIYPIAGGASPYTAQIRPESEKLGVSVQGKQVKLSVIQNIEADSGLTVIIGVWDKDNRYTSASINVSKPDTCE